MASIVFTQEQIDAVVTVLAGGISSVQVGDRQVQYMSKKDLLELLQLMQASGATSVDTSKRSPNNVAYKFSKKGRCE
jgi:hypothetical protein